MSSIARREGARRRAVRYGVGSAVVALLVTVFAVTSQNGLPDYAPGVDRTTLKIAFEDVGALRPGDDIRIAGIRAGYIQSIRIERGHPVVTAKLDRGDTVHADATARIAARSSLGQKYVDLDPGTTRSQALVSADVLPVAQTSSSVELDDVLGTFDTETRAAAGSTLRQLGGGLGGRGDGLNDALRVSPNILQDAGRISSALGESGGQDLTSTLVSARTLAQSLDDQSAAIEADVRQLATTVKAFDADRGRAVRDMLRKAPATLAAARHSLDSLNRPLDETQEAATRLRPGAVALGRATPDTRGLLREAVPPLKQVPPVGKLAERAVTALTPAVERAQTAAEAIRAAMQPISLILATLSPYAAEALDVFTNAASAVHLGDSNGNWLRIAQIFSPEIALGVHTPLNHREAYPAPGEAGTHRDNALGAVLQ